VLSKKNYFYILIPLASFFYFLSTPPLSITPFYFLSFTIIFYLYLGEKSFNLKLLFLFFFLNYFFSLSWISQSFQTGGALYIALGILMIFLLSIFLALLNIFFIGLLNKIVNQRNIRIILIPLSLTLVSIIKEFLLGGFPWNPSSIIWVNNLYILKIIQFIGIYGFGIINHLLIALFLYGLFNKQKIILLLCFLLILVV
jgi:apolipoprotein N-acyltransferase